MNSPRRSENAQQFIITGPQSPQNTNSCCLSYVYVHFWKFAQRPKTVFTRFDTNAKANAN